ncbi:nitroreductase family protein [Murdochiella massiliensis]|uniref:nitroreductase family protein n=1 Tax=Murdochiella massiliensis TaxID=1673723 RepID=UPI00082CE012|nr:nitroreductase family protein [Murdochiella massiliensis]
MKSTEVQERQQGRKMDPLAAQHNHRTIRQFTDEPIDKMQIEEIKAVADRTASSMGLQMASVLRITDKSIRTVFGEVTGQPYVADAPELWVFVADLHRNATIVEQKTGKKPVIGMGKFMSAYADALLMAQNVINAVEALGLGGAFIGSIANDLSRIQQALHLPDGTYAAIAVIFGHPDQMPQQKPRMPKNMRFFENTYPTDDAHLGELDAYDEQMQAYTDLRHPEKTLPSFTDQAIRSLSGAEDGRDALLSFLSCSGFQVRLEDDEFSKA